MIRSYNYWKGLFHHEHALPELGCDRFQSQHKSTNKLSNKHNIMLMICTTIMAHIGITFG